MRTCVQCGREHSRRRAKRCHACAAAYSGRGDASPPDLARNCTARATSEFCIVEGCGRKRYILREGRNGKVVHSARYCARHQNARAGKCLAVAARELHAVAHAAAQAEGVDRFRPGDPPPRCPDCFAKLARGKCPECERQPR